MHNLKWSNKTEVFPKWSSSIFIYLLSITVCAPAIKIAWGVWLTHWTGLITENCLKWRTSISHTLWVEDQFLLSHCLNLSVYSTFVNIFLSICLFISLWVLNGMWSTFYCQREEFNNDFCGMTFHCCQTFPKIFVIDVGEWKDLKNFTGNKVSFASSIWLKDSLEAWDVLIWRLYYSINPGPEMSPLFVVSLNQPKI